MQKLFQFPRVIIFMILFSFLSLAAVIFTPAYPELAKQFNLTDFQSQWMMTIFLLGTTIGRLPYSPLANRYGRKKTLCIGIFISLIGTLFTIFAPSYSLICVGRFIQALGCSSTLKIGYTMIGDIHQGPEATKALSKSMFAYAILPGIGTAVSGYLTPYFGWQGGFWVFALFTIVFLFSCLFLPETLKEKDRQPLNMKRVIQGYGVQFKDFYLVLWSCLMGLSTAILFIFSQEAPFIAIDLLGMTSVQYGTYYLIPAIGIAAGSFATNWMAGKISPSRSMLYGIFIIFFSGAMMGAFFMGGWKSGWALFIPQVVVQFGDAVLYTFASSQGISNAKDKSNASAIMLFINSLISVLGTFLVGLLVPRSLISLPLVFVFISGLMFLLWIALRARCRKA